jgi:hypothetical protein
MFLVLLSLICIVNLVYIINWFVCWLDILIHICPLSKAKAYDVAESKIQDIAALQGRPI